MGEGVMELKELKKKIEKWKKDAGKFEEGCRELQEILFKYRIHEFPYKEPNRCRKCGKGLSKTVTECPYCGNRSFVENPKKVQINNHFNSLINNLNSLINLMVENKNEDNNITITEKNNKR